MSNIVYYHRNCPDGIGAAWALRHILPESKTVYIPKGPHEKKFPNFKEDCNIYIVDLSFDRNIIIDMKERSKSLIVLDHHKTGLERLGDLSFATIDMNHSGAMLAWKYAQEKDPSIGDPPFLIKMIEDRDIWKWELEHTKEVLACLDSYSLSFESLDLMSKMDFADILKEGRAVSRINKVYIDKFVNKAKIINFEGYKIPATLSCLHNLKSEIGQILSEGYPFSLIFSPLEKNLCHFSMRSRKEGVDVCDIASRNGGGGHKHAAAFRGSIDLVKEYFST